MLEPPPPGGPSEEDAGENSCVATATTATHCTGVKEAGGRQLDAADVQDQGEEDQEGEEVQEQKEDQDPKGDGEQQDRGREEDQAGAYDVQAEPQTPSSSRPAPPTSLRLSGSRPGKKKVLVAPVLSLSLGRSETLLSDEAPACFLSPSPEDEDDGGLDFDLDAMETPSDSESLPFADGVLDLEDDLRRLDVACGSGGPGALEREDTVDPSGTRWRRFSTGEPPQVSRVNMSVLEPFLRVLAHGGYYGDGNDIIVFSSCYLPENSLENYRYVMDNLFRYVVGTLELMVAENYVIVYLCAGGQKDRLPGIGWLRECYAAIARRLRKNLKGLYLVHPTWYIKALVTVIKPFISSKFSRKLRFVDSLEELGRLVPTEYVQIPACVRQYDLSLSR